MLISSAFRLRQPDSGNQDITVTVGNKKEKFYLHRLIIIITASSTYFQGACKPMFREGRTKNITIAEMDADAFRQIVDWFYSLEFKLPKDTVDHQKFVELYMAADYLGVEQLKSAMITALIERLRSEVRTNADECSVQGPSNLAKRLAAAVPQDITPILRKITDVSYLVWNMSDSLLESAKNGEDGAVATYAALLESADSFVRTSLCNSCVRDIVLKIPKTCIGCNRRDPLRKEGYRDRTNSPFI